jgi:hypothetical protein
MRGDKRRKAQDVPEAVSLDGVGNALRSESAELARKAIAALETLRAKTEETGGSARGESSQRSAL